MEQLLESTLGSPVMKTRSLVVELRGADRQHAALVCHAAQLTSTLKLVICGR